MQENQDQKQIELGCRVKDTVTGFTGIATGRYEKITGQISFGVESAHNFSSNNRGKAEHEEQWFDAERLEYVDDGIIQRGVIGTEALTPDQPFNAMSESSEEARQFDKSMIGTADDPYGSKEQTYEQAQAQKSCSCGAVLEPGTAHEPDCDAYQKPQFELGEPVVVEKRAFDILGVKVPADALISIRGILPNGDVTLRIEADGVETEEFLAGVPIPAIYVSHREPELINAADEEIELFEACAECGHIAGRHVPGGISTVGNSRRL